MGTREAGLASGVSIVLLLLAAVLGALFNVPVVHAGGAIYILFDGSIYPPTASITTTDRVTYILLDNISDEIVVQRNDIIIDGNGHTLRGPEVEHPFYSSGFGFTLSGVSNVTIENTTITNFACGIWLSFSSDNTLHGNNATDNEYGILLESSNNNTLSGNSVTANKAYHWWGGGIYLRSSSNNTLHDNNVTASIGNGVYLGSSSNNTLSGNDITNSAFGILLESSTNNTLSSNNAANNHWGIYIYYSSDNKILRNNFLNNTQQTGMSNSTNTWDDGYPSGGNYWSDYLAKYPNATEVGSSGIWNTPYVIDADNADHYPLTNQTIIPEFPSHTILLLLMLATAATAINSRRQSKTGRDKKRN